MLTQILEKRQSKHYKKNNPHQQRAKKYIKHQSNLCAFKQEIKHVKTWEKFANNQTHKIVADIKI